MSPCRYARRGRAEMARFASRAEVVSSRISATCSERKRRPRSALVVLVVPTPPDAVLVTPFGCAVEPLIHAPQAVQSARIGGIRVIDDAVLERERAQARPLARVRGHVGSGHGRH